MKLSPSMVLRPVCLFIALGLVVLLIPNLVITAWYITTSRIEHTVKLISIAAHNQSRLSIETRGKLLLPLNSSTVDVARVLSSYLNGSELSFSTVETKVAPHLFLIFLAVPDLTQISYIGVDGILFSYYKHHNQTLVVYSNTSNSSLGSTQNATIVHHWYTQLVDHETGKRVGQALTLNSVAIVNEAWFQEALNRKNGYASLRTAWIEAKDLLFLHTVSINGKGVISLGFPAIALRSLFSDIYLYGGYLYLATRDGKVLTQTGPPNTNIIFDNKMVSIQIMKPNSDLVGRVFNISCEPQNCTLQAFGVNVWGLKYTLYCGLLELGGVQLVYVYSFPQKGLLDLIHGDNKLSFLLLLVMLASVVLSIVFFVLFIVRAARREIFLCGALIKQMEATQQAERKSMNKSLAFARANHDVRNSLSAITTSIELCCHEVAPDSDLKRNLIQMDANAMDLLRILDSVLDTSKIEVGKMQLEEEEFNLAKLLEDVVDLFYPIGVKKGIDVILDSYDGSLFKFSLVKGDRGKLRQILCNLLSNAVKFTSEGHVSVRSWAKKPSLENCILASKRGGFWSCFSRLIYKSNKAYDKLGSLHPVQQNPNFTEFVFEVDDTGKGIPKEKQESVFENFVQVKETDLGQEGIGLGLGIVQSLVRLMGGEIVIENKGIGEKGTCFKFNIFLATSGTTTVPVVQEEDTKLQGDHLNDSYQLGYNIWNQSPRSEGSHVVLLIQGDERRRISQKLMESLGIKVSVLSRWEHLSPTLQRMKNKLRLIHYSSSGKSELGSLSDSLGNSPSYNPNVGVRDGCASIKDGSDYILPLHIRASFRSALNFLLIVIDVSAGPFLDMRSVVANFNKELYNHTQCMVVWLNKSITCDPDLRSIKENMLASYEQIVSQPFHGSSLYRVLSLLPEFGGTIQFHLPKPRREATLEVTQPSRDPSLSPEQIHAETNCGILQQHHKKPLSGKNILIVEDSAVLRRLNSSLISRLGAVVEFCENGEEAVDRVFEALSKTYQREQGPSVVLPYDYIFMDCEMPIMDGYEATRQIRMEEKRYGIHIPIIALTAHATSEEKAKTKQAGMDLHITKPVKGESLLDVIRMIDMRNLLSYNQRQPICYTK
ncbi:PREDICTED: histidine kinase CKI1 [Nelumbo nucifera]|uniref:histidine kinase n=1 Tax=Nelumbo nucifera TaxID=4432 RepID=A0A1U8PZY2_NELNU|nr:PREDICTED: histidine kinase CKI1 [Nelumbo nucifera]XP_010247779.1 PREDICTED: histidine kinase CKI1 [Nelumbo nucifera]XP_010247780.1 PREDICTED: histidine kinase CKI1 [Nelumbo nucifera]XP_019052109.1 PREDICTED: histidine kinase CKI1 [Nelumbo nucifera]